jgi:hypothetical protein
MSTFIISSFTNLPDFFFSGYCFSGSDYIYGHEGLSKYRLETGNTLEPGEDGCYVTLNKHEGVIEIGGDYAGFKKIFYYWNGKDFCISNSLEFIANHVKLHGQKLTLNEGSLEALKIYHSITTCLSTFQTIFKEINLLPSYRFIRFDGISLTTPLRKKTKIATNYENALSEFLEIWISRFETLLHDENINFGCQLTGGKDSRAVFSILERARQRSEKKSTNATVISGKSEKNPLDYEIAEKIADVYNIPIQGQGLEFLPKMSTEESYQLWKEASLGLYSPIYFQNRKLKPSFLLFSGIGGENYRQFYNFEDAKSLIRNVESNSKYSTSKWEQIFLETIKELEQISSENKILTSHYCEFRSRIHGGRTPQNLICFPPLASKFLHGDLLTEDQHKLGQLNFDIMESCLPGLWDFPFDKSEKSPTDTHRELLTKVEISHKSNPGKVFIGKGMKIDNSKLIKLSSINRMKLLERDLLIALNRPEVINFLDNNQFKLANETIKYAVSNGKLTHAWDGQLISRIMTLDMALRFT